MTFCDLKDPETRNDVHWHHPWPSSSLGAESCIKVMTLRAPWTWRMCVLLPPGGKTSWCYFESHNCKERWPCHELEPLQPTWNAASHVTHTESTGAMCHKQFSTASDQSGPTTTKSSLSLLGRSANQKTSKVRDDIRRPK